MTIASQTRTAGPYVGTGLVSAYPFAFRVFASSDLVVVVTATNGVSTTLVLDSDYTVALNLDQNTSPGGTITLSHALASGYAMVITSAMPATQGVSLPNGGAFYPEIIEAALDKLTILAQESRTGVAIPGRAMRVPLGESIADIPRLADRTSRILGFDSSGNPMVGAVSLDQVAAAVAVAVPDHLQSESAVSINLFDRLTFAEQLDAIAGGLSYDLSPKIQSALDELSTHGGCLRCRGGIVIGIDSDISIPNKVSFVSDGKSTIRARSGASFTRAMVLCGEYVADGGEFPNGGYGNREGTFANFNLHGGYIAPALLYVGGAVQRMFQSINGIYAAGSGLIIDGAQNNTFIDCHFEKNGNTASVDASNIIFDRGAGNNRLIGSEFSSRSTGNGGKYNVLFRQTGTSPNGAFVVPTRNVISHSVIERTAASYLASVCFRAGNENIFDDCDLHAWTAVPVVQGTSADGSNVLNSFSNCRISGASAATGISLTNPYRWRLSNCTFEACPIGITSSAGGSVMIDGHLHESGVGTMFSGSIKIGWIGGGRPGVSINRGDASVTLTPGTDYRVQQFATPLTANRTITLDATDIEASA